MQKQLWWSPRAIRLHLVIVIVIPSFTALCLWQIHRALNGNGLSWAYVFEWPFFGGYAIYMWWRFLHEMPATASTSTAESTGDGPSPVAARDAGSDPQRTHARADGNADNADTDADERSAYNDYLSQLASRGKRKQWR